MPMRPWSAWMVLLLAGFAQAQPPLAPPLPGRGPAPLLFARLNAPAGTKVTFFQGRTAGRTFPAPATVGLRPGYIYRVAMTDFPGRPELSLSPTLEVRNTLALPPGILAANYPALVTLTEEDIQAVLSGALVTKVIYLEHPDKAEPVASDRHEPLESTLPPDRDLMGEARERGRPMLVFRVGGRVFSVNELAAESIPGTMLLPGARSLAWPAAPPLFGWDCIRFFDPRHGPRPPEEECLHDGGDRGSAVTLDNEGMLRGLDAEDTVAEWTDCKGSKHVTPSNRVCLCVPRYAVLRSELPLGRYENVVRLDDRQITTGGEFVRLRLPPVRAEQIDQLKAVKGRDRPTIDIIANGPVQLTQIQVLHARILDVGPFQFVDTPKIELLTEVQRLAMKRQVELVRVFDLPVGVRGVEQVQGTAVVGRPEGGIEVVRAIAAVRDITVCCNEAPCPPDKPLRLFKWADRQAAQVGDTVTFSMKYTNVGGRAITDVAVSDSLSPRLEYVPGSSQADRDAVFSVQPNEAGSVVLRWEIAGKLQPGESGVVRFQAKVR